MLSEELDRFAEAVREAQEMRDLSRDLGFTDHSSGVARDLAQVSQDSLIELQVARKSVETLLADLEQRAPGLESLAASRQRYDALQAESPLGRSSAKPRMRPVSEPTPGHSDVSGDGPTLSI